MDELIYDLTEDEGDILEKGRLIYEDMLVNGRYQTGWVKTRGVWRFQQGVKGEWAICLYRGVDPWDEIRHCHIDFDKDGILFGWRYDSKYTPHIRGRMAYNPSNTNHDLTKTDIWILTRPVARYDGWVVRVEGYMGTRDIPDNLESFRGGEGNLRGVPANKLYHLDDLMFSTWGGWGSG